MTRVKWNRSIPLNVDEYDSYDSLSSTFELASFIALIESSMIGILWIIVYDY